MFSDSLLSSFPIQIEEVGRRKTTTATTVAKKLEQSSVEHEYFRRWIMEKKSSHLNNLYAEALKLYSCFVSVRWNHNRKSRARSLRKGKVSRDNKVSQSVYANQRVSQATAGIAIGNPMECENICFY